MKPERILIGIGGNLPLARIGPPLAVMQAALLVLPGFGIDLCQRSRWYQSAPVPPSGQPPFVNGVLDVASDLDPLALLSALHAAEDIFERRRGARNAARTLDLDLLAYGARVENAPGGLQLPHPRLHLRAFVLAPLSELAPDWRHPLLGRSASELLAALPEGQWVEAMNTEHTPASGLLATSCQPVV
ncbi:MAG: 2-amino-4-hydroxy-6-hydroxymethyldihydropteridine diphosphokinase [Rhodospirillales bacterium]|nr:2-amino-4-hydroxy-6-hydroxymethyldihydropteridine diphosphokinase [Rhodospirillales bacterium]